MGYNLLLNGLYKGYKLQVITHLLTFNPNFQWGHPRSRISSFQLRTGRTTQFLTQTTILWWWNTAPLIVRHLESHEPWKPWHEMSNRTANSTWARVLKTLHLDLLVWWLKKIKHIPQIVVQNGDECHSRICKNHPKKNSSFKTIHELHWNTWLVPNPQTIAHLLVIQ